jgi:LmbE family N-acetylglucosaminyl deacetylase
MKNEQLRLLVLGAHPDDAEFHAGGLAARYRQLGHQVKLVSVTNGVAGHHQLAADELAVLRRDEAAAAGRVIGAEYEVWDFPDGALTPSLAVRGRIIREIRTFRPDLVLTHRPCDYHPDHRAVGQAVQDASYLVTVPLVEPDAPALRQDPVVAYMPDLFTKPYPLQADVVLDVEPQVETIVAMLACHESQVFQWLPYEQGVLDQVPEDAAERLHWLRGWFAGHATPRADRYRSQLKAQFGAERGGQMQWIEVYEISEYAAGTDAAALARLFPAGTVA